MWKPLSQRANLFDEFGALVLPKLVSLGVGMADELVDQEVDRHRILGARLRALTSGVKLLVRNFFPVLINEILNDGVRGSDHIVSRLGDGICDLRNILEHGASIN